MHDVAPRRLARHSSLAVAFLLAGCAATGTPSVIPPSVESGLAGEVVIDGGPLDGTYAVRATPEETVCQRSGENWVIGFAKQELVPGVTTLQLAGSGQGGDARLQDLVLTVGETSEENTIRLPDAAALDFSVAGDQVRATAEGTGADGVEVRVSVACAPLVG